jgi:cell division protein FtsX
MKAHPMIPARSLLLSDPAANRALALLVGVLVFLFMLCLLAVGLVYDASQRMNRAAQTSWVVIAPADTARNNQVLEVLNATRGLESVTVLDANAKAQLLARWLAAPPEGADLPLVIDIRVQSLDAVDSKNLQERLKDVDEKAYLDTGGSFKDSAGAVLAQVQRVLTAALAMLLVVLLGLVYLVTKITLQHNLTVLELLHLMGRFQIIAARLVAPATLLGALLALGVIALIFAVMPDTGLGWLWQNPDLSNWPVMALVPLAVLGIAVLTCRQTVRLHLRRTA